MTEKISKFKTEVYNIAKTKYNVIKKSELKNKEKIEKDLIKVEN